LVGGVAPGCAPSRRAAHREGSNSDEELWHDWVAHGIAPAQAASKPPLIVPGVARGAEHGARQCTGAILYEEVVGADNEPPIGDLGCLASRRQTRVLYGGFEATRVD